MQSHSRYVVDPEDPRAPTVEQWAALTPEEREQVVEMLPAEVPLDLLPNEGDPHRKAKRGVLDALDGYFRTKKRPVYVSSEIGVYYPGEARFSPDVLAVTDVEPHDRMRWVVSAEGKGLDFVLEVHVAGDRRKDEKSNVVRYARLGISEYFFYDRPRNRLTGFRLMAPGQSYTPILPQLGRFTSTVLGLELAVEGTRVRFFSGNAPLEDADEMVARLGSMVDDVISGREEAERRADALEAELGEVERQREEEKRQREEEKRQREEEKRLREEEKRLREEAERRLAEALEELARVRGDSGFGD